MKIYSANVYCKAFKRDIKLAVAIFYKDGKELLWLQLTSWIAWNIITNIFVQIITDTFAKSLGIKLLSFFRFYLIYWEQIRLNFGLYAIYYSLSLRLSALYQISVR